MKIDQGTSPDRGNCEEWLRTIASRASTLWERLESEDYAPVESKGESEEIQKRIERWQHLVGRGTLEVWEKRLRWSEWDIDSVRPFLGQVRLRENLPLPQWCDLLGRIVNEIPSELSELPTPEEFYSTERKGPKPFEDLLLPFVMFGEQLVREKVEEVSSVPLDFLTPSALWDLRSSLLSGLLMIMSKTLMKEFEGTRTVSQNFFLSMLGSKEEEQSTKNYEAFVRKHQGDRFQDLFTAYPVMARLVATRLIFWSDAISEFLLRFHADYNDIIQTCSEAGEPGKIASLKLDTSDSHHRGRKVVIVTFESGARIVYKPKDIQIEAAYGRILAWAQDRGLPLTFRDLQVIARPGYGWVGFVQQEPCRNEEEREEYYRNAGIQMAILYILGARDLHYENLIACGKYPVIIDLETLLYSEVSEIIAGQNEDAFGSAIGDLVIYSGLLPQWITTDNQKQAFDISGLGGVESRPGTYRTNKFFAVNTDDMYIGQSEQEMEEQANVPMVGDQRPDLQQYVETIVEGFRQGYGLMIQEKERLLEGPFKELRTLPIRHINRATRIYGMLLFRIFSPEYYKDGADRSIELDVLNWSFLPDEVPTSVWPIGHAEIQSMEIMDIPWFWTLCNSRTLFLDEGEIIENFFAKEAWTLVKERIDGLDEVDMNLQIRSIQGTFQAKLALDGGESTTMITPEDITGAIPGKEELIAEAERLAGELLEAELSKTDSGSLWLGNSWIAKADRYQYSPVDAGLYNGNSGIALFMGTLAHVTGNDTYHQAALRGMAWHRTRARNIDHPLTVRWADAGGLDISAGIAGPVYTLLRLGQMFDDPMLIEEASNLARLMTPTRIEKDKLLDVLGGIAGALLVLTSLYDETGDQEILETAITCGEHLLNTRVEEQGIKVWKTIATSPLTGYSHGMSGIADALLRLWGRSGDERFRAAALEALRYEELVYAEEKRNWPDLRHDPSNGEVPYGAQWCLGAAGIGLARLEALSYLATPAIKRDVEIALQTTLDYGIGTKDDLCCGDMGRADILLTAGLRLGRHELVNEALRRAGAILQTARNQGGYRLISRSGVLTAAPGLFKGIAGVGYALLRLAAPEKIPSVLLLEGGHAQRFFHKDLSTMADSDLDTTHS